MSSSGWRIGLVAGEGRLPVGMAEEAARLGHHVTAYALSKDNRKALAEVCAGGVVPLSPGLMRENLTLIARDNLERVVFGGKVHKGLLLQNPRLDRLALDTLRHLPRLNDDAIMLALIQLIEAEGVTVLPQSDFLKPWFQPAGALSLRLPTEAEWADIHYGFDVAKALGGIDVGQTVVVRDRMVLALEAIEGTDVCLRRAGGLARRQGGVVVKVAKPEQDRRFDLPTVGLRTLKTMRAAGLSVLAVEAEQTLVLDEGRFSDFANRHKLCVVVVPEPKSAKPDISHKSISDGC